MKTFHSTLYYQCEYCDGKFSNERDCDIHESQCEKDHEYSGVVKAKIFKSIPIRIGDTEVRKLTLDSMEELNYLQYIYSSSILIGCIEDEIYDDEYNVIGEISFPLEVIMEEFSSEDAYDRCIERFIGVYIKEDYVKRIQDL